MSSATPRPTPPRPPSKRDEKGDRSTGVRVRTSDPKIEDAPEVPQAAGIRNNSIAPESLRKPFASLAPSAKKRTDSDLKQSPTPATTTTAPEPEMGWDEKSSLTASRSRPSRATCKKHKIAKGKDGDCMLCKKEQQSSASGLGWKLIVGLMVLAVIGAAIAALSV